MKQSMVFKVVLIALMVLGWVAFIFAPKNKVDKEIDQHIEQAESYLKYNLYQKAIAEYDEAIKLKDTEQLWIDKMAAYERLFEFDNETFYKTYLKAAKESVLRHPDNVDFQLVLADLFVYKNDYVSAYKSLTKAVEGGFDDERITDRLFEVKYAYKLYTRKNIDFTPCINGVFAVSRRPDTWTYMNADGTTKDNTNYFYAGPVGDEGIRLVAPTESRVYLIDKKDVIQGFIDFVPENCGVFAEELIAIDDGQGYSYYDRLGDVQFNGARYEYAGTFSNGTAAVCRDGQWYIIDTDGEEVDGPYEDIALYQDGTYSKNGVKMLKENGEYNLYVNDELIASYSKVDKLSEDGIFAFAENGKWGYADLQGNVIVEPQYARARSFSNGLAAVFNGQLWGFINKNGEVAIDFSFEDVGYFTEERCCMVTLPPDETLTPTPTPTPVPGEGPSEPVIIWQMIFVYNEI